MFLTWQLWASLRYPTRQHPLFQQARGLRQPAVLRVFWRVLLVMILVLVLAAAILSPESLLLVMLGTLIALPVFLIVFHASLLGMLWVTMISTSIEAMHEQKRYDLMQLAPAGALGMVWQLAIGIMHRHNWLLTVERVLRRVLLLSCVLLILVVLAFAGSLLTAESGLAQRVQANVLRDVVYLSVLPIIIWLDFVQSNLIAMLLGIVAPGVLRDPVQSRLVLPIVFLTIQVITYASTLLIFRISAVVAGALQMPELMQAAIVVLISGLAFFSLRELQISVLLRLVLQKYDATILDLQQIVHQPE